MDIIAVMSFIYVLNSLLISLATGKALIIGLPVSLALGFVSYRDPSKGFKALLFLLPFSGLIANLLSSAPVISFLLLPSSAWITGYYLNALKNKRGIERPPLWGGIVAFLLIVYISEAISFLHYTGDIPEWGKTVAVLYYGREVNLAHAFGWIVFGTVSWSCGFVMFTYIHDMLKNRRGVEEWFKYMEPGLWAAVIVGLLQKYIFKSFLVNPYFIIEGRISSTFPDPNSAGYALLIIISIMTLSRLKTQKRREFARWLVLICCLVIVMLHTGSRSSVAGLVIVMSLMAMFRYKEFFKHTVGKWKIILPALLCLAAVIMSTESSVKERFKSLTGVSASSGGMLRDRMPYWKVGAHIFKKNYLYGTGVGRYLLVLPDVLRKNSFRLHTPNETACNLFLQAGAEMGIAGFLLISFIIVGLLIKSFSVLRSEGSLRQAAGLVCAFICVSLTIGHHIMNTEVSLLFWFSAALMWGGVNGADREERPGVLT